MGSHRPIPRAQRCQRSVLWSSYCWRQGDQRLVSVSLLVGHPAAKENMANVGMFYDANRNSIGSDFQIPLRDTILMLTARAIAQGYSKMVLRRLYVAVGHVYTHASQGELKDIFS